ncbi:MAG: hypothetical protein DCC65_09255 [Planctomycetota bacterium]|nr:MAG: hypothetical protein DCC65_09255 [Planctomycetota bacterium]
MKGKKIAVPIILVVGIGVSAYLWSVAGGESEDTSVMAKTMSYTCANCSHQFSLTVEEATNMRRNRGDIYCPSCNQAAAQKEGVQVQVSGSGFKKDSEGETEEQPLQEEDPKPRASGGAKKINQ